MTAWRNNNSPRPTMKWVGCLLLALLVLSSLQLFAQTESNYRTSTAAGTNITNNASVNYTVGGVAQTPISSNSVTTVVQQIDSFYLELNNVVAVPTPQNSATRTQYSGTPNQTIDVRYTIHNLSNGTIAVNPTLAFGALIGGGSTNNASGSNTGLYTDDNNGNATTTPLPTTVEVTGNTYVFHVKVVLPNAATATNDWGEFTVAIADNPAAVPTPAGAAGNWTVPTAFTGGAGYSGADLQHTVQINVTTKAAMVLDKWYSTAQGNPATKITHGLGGLGNKFWVNLTYTNNGSLPSGPVSFTDVIPSGMHYVAGSAYFNAIAVGSSESLTNANGGNGGTGSFTYTAGSSTVNATVTNVPQSSGVVYYFAFQVTVDDAPATITNSATTSWSDGGSPAVVTNGTVIANYTVDPRYAITLTNLTPGTGIQASGNVASPTLFLLNVANGGNAADMIYVSNNIGTFPPNTTFRLYTNAGTVANPAIGTSLTLISGTDGQPNAVYQLGQIAVSGSMTYVLAVQVPVGTASANGVNYTTTATATGQAGAGTGSDKSTANQTITNILDPIDLQSAITVGTPIDTNSIGHNYNLATTGTTPASYPTLGFYTYSLTLVNNELQAENMKLVASNSSTFSTSDTLPSGWSVAYYDASGVDCTTPGAQIVGAFNVPASSSKVVCAKVTIPFGTPVAPAPVYFQATSTLNPPANDYVHDALNVTAFHYLTIDTQAKYVNAGASILYTAVISNYGNVAEPATASYFSSVTNATSSTAVPAGPAIFTVNSSANSGAAAPYINASASYTSLATAGGNGLAIAAATPGVATPTNFYIQVTADNTDKPGDKNVTTVVFTFTGNSGSTTVTGTYTTTVLSAATNVLIQKTQALDAACDGSATVFGTAVVKAKPGECVAYRITAVNGTGAVIETLYLTDTLQTGYVDFCGTGGVVCGTVPAAKWLTPLAATEGTGGGFTAPLVRSNDLTNLASGQSVTWQFEVKVK